ncbi:hypothetical protein llap_10187 [Limosa lapponica baueri]|uniref:Uncharacterized protein n=1 Tax=Limosa lapponica baueri TaxID=1758121 RepID=A0A2I0U0G7_LIMLA|nr:hypothetical protein llap_10187 [Limosa lapponica baueri]
MPEPSKSEWNKNIRKGKSTIQLKAAVLIGWQSALATMAPISPDLVVFVLLSHLYLFKRPDKANTCDALFTLRLSLQHIKLIIAPYRLEIGILLLASVDITSSRSLINSCDASPGVSSSEKKKEEKDEWGELASSLGQSLGPVFLDNHRKKEWEFGLAKFERKTLKANIVYPISDFVSMKPTY